MASVALPLVGLCRLLEYPPGPLQE
jgi:hypothetical protein